MHLAQRALFWPLTVLILVIGAVPRLYDLGGPSYWTDEVLTYFRASGPLDEVIDNLLKAGNQGPVYYMMMRVLPHDTEFWMRLPSALLGLAGIALFIAFTHDLYKRPDLALWAGALLAANPFHVWLSRTARAYALLFVLTLIVLWITLRLSRNANDEQSDRWWWAAFIIASMLAYLTHYAAGGLAVAQIVLFGVLLPQSRAFWVRWFAAQTVATIPFGLWVLGIITAFEETHPGVSPTPGLADLPLTLWNLGIGYVGDFTPLIIPALVIVSVGVLAGMAFALRQPDWIDRYWLALIIVSLVPVFVISFAATGVYLDRYFIVFLPAALLLLVRGWDALSAQWVAIIMAVLVLSALGILTASFADDEHHREDWRAVADYVALNAAEGDGYLLERPHIIRAFRHYYVDDAVDGSLIHDLNAEPDTTTLEAATERIWVIYRNPIEDLHRLTIRPDFDPFDPELSSVGAWLAEREAQVISMEKFNGVTVLLVDHTRE